MLEDAQKQVRRAGCTISDKTLLIFVSTAMLTMEQFLRTNNNWEDRAKPNKTWAESKVAYKKAHAKTQVKVQANEGSVKLGAANADSRVETNNTTKKVETNHSVDKGGIKSLEGYFDNLAVAAVDKKMVLEQLVENNTKLAATNKDLVTIAKTFTNKIKKLKGKPPASRKQADKEGGTQPCAPIAKKRVIMQLRHALNLLKIKTSAPLVGKARCDSVGQLPTLVKIVNLTINF